MTQTLTAAASIEPALVQLVTDSAIRAVAINGDWGVGKTHRVVHHFKSSTARAMLESHRLGFAYVSLFGVGSLALLRLRICAAAFDHRGHRLLKLVTSKALQVTGDVTVGPVALDLSTAGELASEVIQARTLKNLVVCFDDLERCATGLDFNDVLGLMAELIEQHSCKCIALFNESRMAPEWRKRLRLQDEKLFDLRLEFAPSIQDNLRIVHFDSDDREIIQPVFEAFGIANIRLMRRACWVLRQVSGLRAGHSSETWKLLVEHAGVLTILRHAHSDRIEDLSAALKPDRIAEILFGADGGVSKTVPEDVQAALKSLRFRPSAIDQAIIGLLDTGKLAQPELRDALEAQDASVAEATAHTALSDIFDDLGGSFSLTAAEYVDRIRRFLEGPTPGISLGSIASVVDIMLRIAPTAENTALAERRLTPWLQGCPPDKRLELIGNRTALAAEKFVHTVPYTAPERTSEVSHSIDAIAQKEESWDPAEYSVLALYSENEILAELDSSKRLNSVLVLARLCERLKANVHSSVVQRVAPSLRRVAEIIESRDALQKLRIESFVRKHLPNLKPTTPTDSTAEPEGGGSEQTRFRKSLE